jgi:hypothetical protein
MKVAPLAIYGSQHEIPSLDFFRGRAEGDSSHRSNPTATQRASTERIVGKLTESADDKAGHSRVAGRERKRLGHLCQLPQSVLDCSSAIMGKALAIGQGIASASEVGAAKLTVS